MKNAAVGIDRFIAAFMEPTIDSISMLVCVTSRCAKDPRRDFLPLGMLWTELSFIKSMVSKKEKEWFKTTA